VPSGGSQLPDRHFRYAEFPLRSGSSYSFRFDAAADSSMTIRVVVKFEPPPYTKTLDRTITLSSSMRRYSYPFTSSLSTSQGAIAFYVGGHSGDHVVKVDNVSLVKRG
jgi:endoglucanase